MCPELGLLEDLILVCRARSREVLGRLISPIIAAIGPYKTAHVVGCLHHGELLEGSMDFDLLPDYFEKFDREFAEKLVIEAFEEDTGLKVGSGDAENYEDKEGQDTIEKAEETETTKEDEEKLGKEDDKEDKEEEN